MQFTTTLIASILAVAATAAPGAAAAADVEKRQACPVLACTNIVPALPCIATGLGNQSIDDVLACVAGDSSLLCTCVACVPTVPGVPSLSDLLANNGLCTA